MLVIENCNSLSELRQKLIDGEEVRTVRYESCGDAIRREDAINAVSEALEHVVVENEDVARKMMNKLPSVKPQESCEDTMKSTEKERLIKSDISSIENRVRHAFNQGYDFGYKEEIKKRKKQSKIGHWKAKSFHELFCDNCGFDFDIMRNDFIDKMNYCPNCGARMVEPQESEVT